MILIITACIELIGFVFCFVFRSKKRIVEETLRDTEYKKAWKVLGNTPK